MLFHQTHDRSTGKIYVDHKDMCYVAHLLPMISSIFPCKISSADGLASIPRVQHQGGTCRQVVHHHNMTIISDGRAFRSGVSLSTNFSDCRLSSSCDACIVQITLSTCLRNDQVSHVVRAYADVSAGSAHLGGAHDRR